MHVVESSEEKIAKDYLHAVIVPFPAQGHVNPCMQLARKLVKLGFRITFVNSTHTHKRIVKSNSEISEPNIQLVEVSDRLPDDHPRIAAGVTSFIETICKMGPEFEDLFARLVLESSITCAIIDVTMPCVFERVQKFGIPIAAFSPFSALTFHCISRFPTLESAGILPLPPPVLDPSFPSVNLETLCLRPAQSDIEAVARDVLLLPSLLPGAPRGMKVKDIPTALLEASLLHTSPIHKFISDGTAIRLGCLCVLINTFYEVETEMIDAMVGHVNSNIYSIGPLVLSQNLSCIAGDGIGEDEPSLVEVQSAFWKQDSKALWWLDSQAAKSVLFISIGSVAQPSVIQILELAYGLEQSKQKFLWVIRPDLAEHLATCHEFSEFSQRIRERALLVSWVPQVTVLSHPSIGAFLTHCGWNSVMESISSGVSMLGWPFYGDQTTNCFYMAHVLSIGLEVEFSEIEVSNGGKEYFVLKEEVAKKVNTIMAKEGEYPEIDSIRKRCKQLQRQARNAMRKGGSSHDALFRFVKQITSSSRDN